MPLLLRRRSVLDLLNIKADNEQLPRPAANNTTTLLRPDPPNSPRPVSEYGPTTSRLSHELQPEEVEEDVVRGGGANATKRFSLMKLKNFSESHLAVRARDDAAGNDVVPPLPTNANNPDVPSIVRTAPTMDASEQHEEVERQVRPSFFKRSLSKGRLLDSEQQESRKSSEQHRKKSGEYKRENAPKGHSLRWRRMQGRSTGLEDLARLSAMNTANNHHDPHAPPSYGDASKSALALPVPEPRFSESSRSDDSNGSGEPIYGSTTTTTHTVSTHTTFFRLPRRNKKRNSLFPLPVKIPPPNEESAADVGPATPRASISAYSTKSMQTPDGRSPPATALRRRHTEVSPTKQLRLQQQPALPSSHAVLGRASLSFAAEPGAMLVRNESQRSRNSGSSSPLQPPARLGMRDRASTASSFGRASHDMDNPPGFNTSARNSTSTTGRSSLGGFLNLARFRQGSDPHSPRHGSPGTRSKSNSFALSREALVVPEREEGDTPGKYLERLEAAVARSMIAGILSKSSDPFAQSVLRSYTRRFPFFGEPIDMSLRKFLLEAELPKETQQVDRVIQAFADRYHECNPGIFMAAEQAYIIAFSLMMLHTDAFNKNNKRKMQKQDYIKNTSGQQVADDVLACFYDNICYTPFVHYEEEVDINGERVLPFKPKKSKLKGAIQEGGKKPSGPVDPYNLLVDQKLDLLRPPLRDAIALDDPYDYRGSQGVLDPNYLQRAFTHTGVLQIISARSRPAAYEAQLTSNNPNPTETQAGIVDLKITKVGTLWRKAAKKKKARSPWQEWGAVLTGSQLYLFKNAHWAKGLLAQFTAQQKHGHARTPVIFKPPLTDFKPDALIKTDNAVALVDSSYTRHKNAFTFFRAGAHEEVLLADNESELNDWLALINYAAAFRAAGVRIRGMVGGNEEDLRRRDVHRLQSTQSMHSVQTATGEVTVSRGGLSPQLQRQVMAARRQIMVQKIAETEKEIVEANKQLEAILRTGRHLLILAPIAPKTREDIMQAAARSDAMIKWVRRNIWRMKCHRDILAMDAQQDGVTAAEMQTITAVVEPQPEESTKKGKGAGLLRLTSKASAPTPARSPPQSPTSSHSRSSARRNTGNSVENYMGNDVFRTPPESAIDQRQGNGWGLPPLQLDYQLKKDEHRPSVSETLLTVSSPGRGSLSHASSTSSMNRVDRLDSPKPSEATSSNKGRITPTPSIEPREVELLARATMGPEAAVPAVIHGLSMDGAPPTSTPESKHKSVRRSLQKTLRDAHHNSVSGSHHKHRRGKESDSTIRSAGGAAGANEGEAEPPEGTPGLQREKGRFILHGKQASVIQFGNQWPNERMKLRREQWRSDSGESSGATPSASPSSPRPPHMSRAEWSDSMASHVVRELAHDGGESESEAEEGSADGTPRHFHRHRSSSLRADAEAAQAYASSPGPTNFSFEPHGAAGEKMSYFDLSTWDPDAGRRLTMVGHRTGGSRSGGESFSADEEVRKEDGHGHGDGGAVSGESDVEDFSLGPRENRITAIFRPDSHGNNGKSEVMARDARPGAEEEGRDHSDDVEGRVDDIDDEDLRRVSLVSA